MFKTKLNMQHVEGTVHYKLLTNLVYVAHDKTEYIVPKGYESDGHSIPVLLRSFVGSPFATKYPKSAWIHDWLRKISILDGIASKEADVIYPQAMGDEGANIFQQKRNYFGVRIGAFFNNLFRRRR